MNLNSTAGIVLLGNIVPNISDGREKKKPAAPHGVQSFQWLLCSLLAEEEMPHLPHRRVISLFIGNTITF